MHIRGSLSIWTAASTIAIPAVNAFYPYEPNYGDEANGNANSRRAILSYSEPQSDSKLNSITLPLRRTPKPLPVHARDNQYNIVNNKDPQQENSVAIDQDGTDLSYMVAVTFGSSKEEYHLLLDSAASNTWVMGQDCTSDACKSHNLFGKGDSDSLKTGEETFDVTYGTGSVSGVIATDTLHIGSLSPSLSFGLANNVSKEFNSYPMDGILGIGRGDSAEGSIDTPQVMDVLKTSNLIGSKLYGIHLSRAQDGLNDGELNFGEPNKDRYDGDLNWLDTVPNDTGFWEIELGDAGVESHTMVGFGGITAIIDTGTSFILMPENDAVSIHDFIDGYSKSGETFSVPCDTDKAIILEFNEKLYNISTKDWVGGKLSDGKCKSNIIGRQTFGERQWLVGDVFLKNVYSVFDFDKSRVGFGVKSGSGNSETSTSPTASATGASATGSQSSPTSGGSSSNPTVAADNQPNGQQGSQSGASGTSTSFLAISVALGLLSLLI